jgi:hypothetical protein
MYLFYESDKSLPCLLILSITGFQGEVHGSKIRHPDHSPNPFRNVIPNLIRDLISDKRKQKSRREIALPISFPRVFGGDNYALKFTSLS